VGGAVRTRAQGFKCHPDSAASATPTTSPLAPPLASLLAPPPRPRRRPDRRHLKPPTPGSAAVPPRRSPVAVVPRRRPRTGEPPCFLGRLPCTGGVPPLGCRAARRVRARALHHVLRGSTELGRASCAGRGQAGPSPRGRGPLTRREHKSRPTWLGAVRPCVRGPRPRCATRPSAVSAQWHSD
jgi:hypothetical protein